MFKSKTNNNKKAEMRRIFQDIKGIDAESEVIEFLIDKLALCGWAESNSLIKLSPTYYGSRLIHFTLFDHKNNRGVGGVERVGVRGRPDEHGFWNWEWRINMVNITNSGWCEWDSFSLESRCDLAGNPMGLFDV